MYLTDVVIFDESSRIVLLDITRPRTFLHSIIDYLAVYKYPGYETSQGWTLEPGNLEGGFRETNKPIWGANPQYSPISPPESPLKIPRFQCPPPAFFHTLDIHTLPC